MILDTCLTFGNSSTKSKQRRELVSMSDVYEPVYKPNKNGECWVYLADASRIKARTGRQPDMTLCTREANHVSSVFIPDVERPYGYGDVKGTSDGLLFVFNERGFELFVCKGKKTNIHTLYSMLRDGELDSEMESLRKRVKTVNNGSR